MLCVYGRFCLLLDHLLSISTWIRVFVEKLFYFLIERRQGCPIGVNFYLTVLSVLLFYTSKHACHYSRKNNYFIKLTVLRQRPLQQQISLSFRLKGPFLDEMNTKKTLSHKTATQVVNIAQRFQWQGWAIAHCPAHHNNNLCPDVHQVWFGWH